MPVYPDYYPILDSFRSGEIENRFFGLLFLYDKKGLKFSIGYDRGAKFFLRSLFKPIQASILDEKIISYFGFDDKELAIMQGSHAGEEIHIEILKSILKKTGVKENELLCPVILPINYKKGKIRRLHNNCSGKHLMMISWSLYNKADYKNYTDFDHPCQLKIKKKLLFYSGCKNNFITTKDGCTAPVYGLTMDDIARAFLNYYKDKSNLRLIKAYKNNPYAAGGYNRTDTKITGLKNLISKVGAGGFIYVYNIKTEEILIVKMAQDNNPQREVVVLEALRRLNWVDEKLYDDKIYLEDSSPIGKLIVNGFDNYPSL